jgi:hypothetical protein
MGARAEQQEQFAQFLEYQRCTQQQEAAVASPFATPQKETPIQIPQEAGQKRGLDLEIREAGKAKRAKARLRTKYLAVQKQYASRGGRRAPAFKHPPTYGKTRKKNLMELDFPQLSWLICVLHDWPVTKIETALPACYRKMRALTSSINWDCQVAANNAKLFLVDLVSAAAPSYTADTDLEWDKHWYTALDLQGLEAIEETLMKDKEAASEDANSVESRTVGILKKMENLKEDCVLRWPVLVGAAMPNVQARRRTFCLRRFASANAALGLSHRLAPTPVTTDAAAGARLASRGPLRPSPGQAKADQPATTQPKPGSRCVRRRHGRPEASCKQRLHA